MAIHTGSGHCWNPIVIPYVLATTFFVSAAGVGTAVRAAENESAKSAPDSAAQLEEIVVTANRRTESVQKSSLAIQVVNADEMAQQGVVQLRDLNALVPAFSVGSRGSFAQLYVRGIGAFITTPLDESPVAVNLDQVYLSSAAGISGMFFDLERLEVLKGPQGTLYGRNASGGAMNIVTRKPDFRGTNGSVSVDVGNYALRLVDGALNVPVSNTLALRGAFQIVDRQGYYTDGSGDDRHQSARLHALWRPGDAFSMLVTGDYAHFGGQGEGYSMFPRVDAHDPYVGLLDPRVNATLSAINPALKPLTQPYQDNATYGAQADLQWNLGGVTLHVIPAWRRTGLDFVTSGSGSVYTVHSGEPQTTLEARLSSAEASRVRWVAGAYYFDSKKSTEYVSDFGVRNQLTIESGTLKNKSSAGFAEATFSATDRLRLIGGIRYTHETKGLVGFTDTTTQTGRNVVLASGDLSFDKTTWKTGLEYDVTQDAMAFLTVATGFKAGGIVLTAPPDGTVNNPFPNIYGPEVLTAYTVGFKSRWLDERLQLNLEGFDWDYKDQQITQNGPVNPVGTLGRVVVNVPDSPKLYGVDASAAWRVTTADLLTVDVAFLNAQYNSLVLTGSSRSNASTTGCVIKPATDPRLALLDCSGFPLIRAPRWSGSVGYTRTFDMPSSARVIAGMRTQFSSGYFTGIDYLPWQWQKDYTNSSVDLTYEVSTRRWSITAYAKNLEDKAVVSASRTDAFAPGVSFDVLNAPRTYGVRAKVDF